MKSNYFNQELAVPRMKEAEFPKGRTFTAKFIEAGACGYKNFKVFVEPYALPSLAQSLKGCPVTLGHIGDMTYEEMLKNAVGYVVNVHSDESGNVWFADFVIFKEEALKSYDEGKTRYVSCTYRPEYSEVAEKRINGINYDRIVIGGEMLELALVKKPRYNDTDVWENSDDDENLIGETVLSNEKGETMSLFGIKKEQVQVAPDVLFNTDAGEKTIEEMMILVNEGEAVKAELASTKESLAAKEAELAEAVAAKEAAETELAAAKEALETKTAEPEGTDAGLKQTLANELEKDPEEITTVTLSTLDGSKK